MLKNPVKPSSKVDEGTVLQVDPLRSVCKVKTMSGQNLDGVQWGLPSGGSTRGGDRVVPTMGDKVKLNYDMGYPRIESFLPRIQTADNKFPLSIDSGEVLVDTGNYSSDGTNAVPDQNKPKDLLVGDRVISSVGGGMMAVLRGGSVLLRSSRLSEIFLSKWDDLVRIVSRNWEHFTDVSTDVVKNLRGRVYRYTGYSNSFSSSKVGAYQYHLYYGDTALAEAVKANHQSGGGGGGTSSIIFKEQVTGGGTMHRTLDLSGAEEVLIQAGGTFTRMNATGGQLTFSFGDSNTITINESTIVVDFGGQQTITVDGSKIELVHSAGATTTMDSGGINSTFNGHFVKVDAGGVHLG